MPQWAGGAAAALLILALGIWASGNQSVAAWFGGIFLLAYVVSIVVAMRSGARR